MTIKNIDNSEVLIAKVKEAYSSSTPLQICAGNSKFFYGRKIAQYNYQKLDISSHTGIQNYEPSELVMTVRAGTSLTEIQKELSNNNQMLAFEPPNFDSKSTIGGSIACGLSGSRRPFVGSARDFILGTTILNGKGEKLRFGGEVIKNVAGYDASRLMTGALGTLGVLLDISIKVLPSPEAEITIVQTLSVDAALSLMTHLKRQALPITGLVYYSGHLFIRLSGTKNTTNKAIKTIGGELLSSMNLDFSWQQLDNQSLAFFNSNLNFGLNSKSALWRISVKSNTPVLAINGDCIYGWAGAERWIISDNSSKEIFRQASRANGHATLFINNAKNNEVFQPLPATLFKIHKNLKSSFDPKGILNPRILYSEI